MLKNAKWRNYIFGELVRTYKLTELCKQFSAHGFDYGDWVSPSVGHIVASEVYAEVARLRDVLVETFVVDRQVIAKEGKHRRLKHVKYSMIELDNDVQFHTKQAYRSTGLIRYYPLGKKNCCLDGAYPTPIVSAHQILGKMIYVLLPDGEMRFCIETHNSDTLRSDRLTHSEIAGMGPVLDAGELFLHKETGKWVIFKINNSSGHYKPRPVDRMECVVYILRNMLKDNAYFRVASTCSIVNAKSTTRMSAVDETTQVLGSNF